MADNTTGDGANTTGGGQDQNTQGTSTGAGTGTADTSQGTNAGAGSDQSKGNNQADPKVEAALKALQEAGIQVYTQQQFNGHMSQARKQWQSEAEQKAAIAAQKAQEDALAEQGKYKDLADQRQAAVQQHEATIAQQAELITRLSGHVNAQIEAAIKNVPAVLREFDPGADNLAARMEWFAKLQKHPEAIQPKSQYGNGWAPQPTGTVGNEKEARNGQATLYSSF